MHTRVSRWVVEWWSRHIWSRFAPIDVYFVHAPTIHRHMAVVYGLGVQMKFSTTHRPSMTRDLSIRDGKTGWVIHGVGKKIRVTYNVPTALQFRPCWSRCVIYSSHKPILDAFGAHVIKCLLHRVRGSRFRKQLWPDREGTELVRSGMAYCLVQCWRMRDPCLPYMS